MGKNMKKIIYILLLCLFISACHKPDVPEGQIELEFWTLQLGAYKHYINGLIDEYEQQHPDIKIKWLDVPFKEGEKRALAAALSNEVPDVINLNPIFSSTLASKKALLNFNDYLTEEQKESYLPAALEACSLGNFTFGIPWYMTSSITIYNKADLEKAGIKSPPHTYDELFQQARLIKKKLNKYAFLPTITEGDYFLKILVKNDIKIVAGQDNSKAVFNSEDSVAILNKFINLYSSDIIPDDAIVTNHQQAVDKFQSGINTFIVIGPNFIKTIKDNAPGLYEHIDVSPQITGTSGKVDFSVMNFVVPVKSKYKKEAVDFALFITNSQNQLAFSKLTPTLPSAIEALNDDFFDAKQANTLEEKARIISANQLKNGALAMPVLRNQQELLSILNFYIQKALLKKLKAEKALEEAAKKWNDILQ
jgi:putative chitobiose transport system substrate-binding protein